MNREFRPIPPIPKPENRIDRHVRNPGSGEARVQMKDGIPHLPDDAIEQLEDIQDRRGEERRTPPLPTSSDRFSRGPEQLSKGDTRDMEREYTLKALRNQQNALQKKIESHILFETVSREDIENLANDIDVLRASHEKALNSSREERNAFFQDAEDSLRKLERKLLHQENTSRENATPSLDQKAAQSHDSEQFNKDSAREQNREITLKALTNQRDVLQGKIDSYALGPVSREDVERFDRALNALRRSHEIFQRGTQEDRDEFFADVKDSLRRLDQKFASQQKRVSASSTSSREASRLVRQTGASTPGAYGRPAVGSSYYTREAVRNHNDGPALSKDEVEKNEARAEARANARFAKALGVASAENFEKILDRATDEQREALRNADILGNETDRATQRARANAKEVASEILTAKKYREIADSLGVSFADLQRAYTLASDYTRRKLLDYDPSLPARERIYVASLIEKLLQSAREADAEEVPPPALRRNGPTTARVRGGTVPALPARSVELSFSPERDSSSSEDAQEITLRNVEVPSIPEDQSRAVRERYGIAKTSEFLTKYTSLFSDGTRADNLLTSEAQAFLNAHTPAEVAALMVKNSTPPKGFFARMKQAVVSLTSEERALQRLVREFDGLMLADVPETSTKQSTRRSTKSRVTPRRPQTTSITRGVAKQ